MYSEQVPTDTSILQSCYLGPVSNCLLRDSFLLHILPLAALLFNFVKTIALYLIFIAYCERKRESNMIYVRVYLSVP